MSLRARLFFAAVLALPGLAAVCPPAQASTPGCDSRIVLDLPPGPDNPRNSEGAFLTLKDGRIIFIYSHYSGVSDADAARACLAARFSSDNGNTWSARDTIILRPTADQAMNVMSVSLRRMRNGDIGLFYLRRRSWHDTRMELIRSADEGRTWSAPVECMPVAGYYTVNNDRVIRLHRGRLLIPAARFNPRSSANEPSALDWRADDVFFYSDDDGRTWRQAPGVCHLADARTETGLQEPGVVELANGVLWGWARTDLGRQYQFFSRDGGMTWSAPAPSRFTSPVSPLAMKRIPGTDRLLAVWNPYPHSVPRARGPIGGDRTPLVMAVTAAAGAATGSPETPRAAALATGAWSQPREIEGNDGRDAGYCYTAIHFVPGGVLLAYCAGGAADHGMLNRLRVRKLDDGCLQP